MKSTKEIAAPRLLIDMTGPLAPATFEYVDCGTACVGNLTFDKVTWGDATACVGNPAPTISTEKI